MFLINFVDAFDKLDNINFKMIKLCYNFNNNALELSISHFTHYHEQV